LFVIFWDGVHIECALRFQYILKNFCLVERREKEGVLMILLFIIAGHCEDHCIVAESFVDGNV
jgi:hypothetical protein